MSSSSHSFCAIHFEGKKGELKNFTEGTLAKLLNTR